MSTDAELSAAVDDTADPTSLTSMSDEELAEAREYGRIHLRCRLLDSAIDVVFLGVMAFWLARPLDAWLANWSWLAGDRSTLRIVALLLITMGLHVAVSFPLSWYTGFRLEHRYGLSAQTFRRWLRNYGLQMLVAALLNAVVFAGLYWIIWLSGAAWWLIAAAAFFFLSFVLGKLLPVVYLPLFYKTEPIDDPVLVERIERLAAGTGISIEGVFRLGLSAETSKANAMLAGLGSSRRVLMGDTLLDSFSPDEIEVVLAHEIGHHVHRHIIQQMVLIVLLSVVSFGVWNWVVPWWAGIDAMSQLPVSALPMLMLLLVLVQLVVEPLVNSVSRRHERQSDRYALETTGLAAAYRSAYTKLARQNKADPQPHPLEVFLFHSHPPIAERVAMADQFS